MSMPYSVEEIDEGMIAEGLDELSDFEYDIIMSGIALSNELERKQTGEYGYWLDNCGDGKWYCAHCFQPDCSKREATCPRGVIK